MSSTSIHGSEEPCACEACSLQYKAEKKQLIKRRKALGLDLKKDSWGLAFSGGGIRSATFCLGVLQAMSRAQAPKFSSKKSRDEGELTSKLLPHFDYLSTVSGGGYIGAFFCSLFKGGRLQPYLERDHDTHDAKEPLTPSKETVQKAAANAYRVLQFDPPGRIHTNKCYDETGRSEVGDGPLAWIRENGRYLTPSGSGDLFYGLALALRNWVSVQFIIGLPVLFILGFITALQFLMRDLAQAYFPLAESVFSSNQFWLPGLIALVCIAPCILAFWMFYAKPSMAADQPVFWNISLSLNCLFAAILASALFALWYGWLTAADLHLPKPLHALFYYIVILEVLAILAGLFAAYLPGPGSGTVKGFRVRVTWWLSISLKYFLFLGFIAFADWVSRWVYNEGSGSLSQLTPAGLLVATVWGIRSLAAFMDDKVIGARALRLPIQVLATPLGTVLVLLMVVVWGVALQWLLSWCEEAWTCSACGSYLNLIVLLVFLLVLIVSSGRFIGFINLSSLQAFYSARLTRAYLGASNGYRFKWEENEASRREKLSVSEALPGDDLTLEEYYGSYSLSPLHLINVTVNLTVDPAERLVQRDRKGLPLCIAPSIYPRKGRSGTAEPQSTYRFILDGRPRERRNDGKGGSEADQPLTVGHWIATSGAAFTTGLGRQTSLGTSLLLGMANIRLGTWWPANFTDSSSEIAACPPEGEADYRPKRSTREPRKFWSRWFPTQTYLSYEFFARFHGAHRDYLYLSDGGHFENTGAYELLRSGRKNRLVVMCDCGADPKYEMGDLANLIRLVRLDQALEIQADEEFRSEKFRMKYGGLDKVLGVFKQFTAESTGILNEGQSLGSTFVDDQCALLFNVYRRGGCNDQRKLQCILLVIKPNLIMHLPDDVRNYAAVHPNFPNEPTVDQFFDEAQFESYRQLGMNMGELLFGRQGGSTSDRTTYEKILWRYLEMKFQQIERENAVEPVAPATPAPGGPRAD